MENQPLISMIVSIYNIEKYLPKCIESICAQTYKNLEIILVEDGSKDYSPRICDEYASRDSRICVIHKKNGGLVSTRKTGIKHATGEYVQFIDGDDWISAKMTEEMFDVMIKYQADCVLCGHYKAGELIYAEKQNIQDGYYAGKDYELYILPKMLQIGEKFSFGIDPAVWAKLFRREQIKEYILHVPSSVSFGEDAACTYPYLLNTCKSIYIMKQSYYYYRQNLASITKAYNKAQTRGTIDLIHYLQGVAEKKGSVEFRKQLDMYSLAVLLWNLSNEKKGGIKQFFQRCQDLKRYVFSVKARECIKKMDLSKIGRKSRMELMLVQYGGTDVLFLILILQYAVSKSVSRMGRIICRRNYSETRKENQCNRTGV